MKLAKKMMKKITYCLNLKKYMRHLIMQNSFVQKMMELNMTLTFPYKDNVFKTKEKEESEEKEGSEEELDKSKFFNDIENKSEGINYDLFETHFNNLVPTVLAKKII